MRRVLATLVGVGLALGAADSASAWWPAATYEIPDGGAATCLRSAGPGQLALFGRVEGTTSTTTLFDVSDGAIVPSSTTTLGWMTSCADAGDTVGGAPLLAASVWNGATVQVAAATPGGGPMTLGGERAVGATVAQAPSGAAVVAWFEERAPLETTAQRRVVAAVRAPGADAFAAAVPVSDWTRVQLTAPFAPEVGIDDAGDVVLGWSDARRLEESTPWLATATAGRPFTAPRKLNGRATPQIAVAPNGRALIATAGTAPLERRDAGSAFAPVMLPGAETPDPAAIALRDDGAAVLARLGQREPVVWLRPAGGTFTRYPPQADAITSGVTTSSIGASVATVEGGRTPKRPSVPSDWPTGDTYAAIGDDGSVVVSWTDGETAAVRAAHGTLTGGLKRSGQLSGPCRTPSAQRIVRLADGRLGVAWTDGRAGYERRPDAALPARVHVSLPGAAAATAVPAPVRISARVVGPTTLRAGQELRVRVTCRVGPCDAWTHLAPQRLPGIGIDLPEFPQPASARSLATGETTTLGVVPFGGDDGRPHRRPGRTPVTVTACAPAGALRQEVTLHPTVRQIQPYPLVRIVGAQARRDGSRVVLTWRTDHPARITIFYARAGRGALTRVGGHGHATFRATLTDVPRATRFVSLTAVSGETDRDRRVRVPIRGR